MVGSIASGAHLRGLVPRRHDASAACIDKRVASLGSMREKIFRSVLRVRAR